MVGVAAMFYDGTLDFIDGVILICPYRLFICGWSRVRDLVMRVQSSQMKKSHVKRALLWVGVGGVLLPCRPVSSCGERRVSPVSLG